ncbi:rCG32303 [Rattus norvegicus]|uniref:RCG32303 n=1 Tax=Rattus norvegicus TaxID=10116 RepID=A6JWR0_RAT|nr:rCG32303 [Rattus norvegicus]
MLPAALASVPSVRIFSVPGNHPWLQFNSVAGKAVQSSPECSETHKHTEASVVPGESSQKVGSVVSEQLISSAQKRWTKARL